MEFKAICNICPVIADCKAAFGKFWIDKSHGGKGCGYPFVKNDKPAAPKMPRRPRKTVQQDLI